jgi:lipoate-protein ligase A
MKYLDLTLPTPTENLACDEALLDWCEAGHCDDEIMRFWEPTQHFVVVGYANRVATEVNVMACEAKEIPILRRCSGGGTVLQGPGCLNYALILKITGRGPLHTIAAANRFIMERNRVAVESATVSRQLTISVSGHTDLAADNLKFSGNSQRRRQRFLLFHGTFLLKFDLDQIGKLLRTPSHQPAYRRGRSHAEFVMNLNLPASIVKSVLREAWEATSQFSGDLRCEIAKLVGQKYSKPEWSRKF